MRGSKILIGLAGLTIFGWSGADAADKFDVAECYGETVDILMKGGVYADENVTKLAVPSRLSEHDPLAVLSDGSEFSDLPDPFRHCRDEPILRTHVSIAFARETSAELFGFDEKGGSLSVQVLKVSSGRYVDLDAHYKSFVSILSHRLLIRGNSLFALQNEFVRAGHANSSFGLYIAPPAWTRPTGDPMTFDCAPTITADASCHFSYTLREGLSLSYRVIVNGGPISDLQELDRRIRAFVEGMIVSSAGIGGRL